jgi:hypothetical protein
VVAQDAGLVGTFTNIVFYISGVRYTATSVANKTYTASKDTYVDIGVDGTVDYSEVANGAASPALAASHIRVAKVVTSGAAITSVTQKGFDTLGNLFSPVSPNIITRPVNKTFFYANRTSALNTAAGAVTDFPFNNEVYDPTNTYDTATYRWTPGVAGFYCIQTNMLFSASTTRAFSNIYLNATEICRSGDVTIAGLTATSTSSATWFGYLGATDYVIAKYFTAAAIAVATTGGCNFSGFLISAA